MNVGTLNSCHLANSCPCFFGFLKMTGLVPPDIYLSSMEEVMGSKKKSIIEINRKAFTAGFEYLEDSI